MEHKRLPGLLSHNERSGEMSARLFQNVEGQRQTGQLSVSTTALPATQIIAAAGVDSPTYTVTTVVNDNAIDLSDVSVGEIVVTNDSYKGLVTAIDDGADTLTVGAGWQDPEGKQGRLGGTVKPTDGQSFSVQRISLSKYITVGADSGNTDIVYLGRDANARITDYPLQPGETLPISDLKYVDVTRVFVLAASGTQTINWILGAPSGAGNYAAVIPGVGSTPVTWIDFTDLDTTPDVSSGTYFVAINTGVTSISDFDGVTNGLIWVFFPNGNTTIEHDASKIVMRGGLPVTFAANDSALFIARNGIWYQAPNP